MNDYSAVTTGIRPRDSLQKARRLTTRFGLSLSLAVLSFTNVEAQSPDSSNADPKPPEFFEAAGDRAILRLYEMGETLFQSMGADLIQTLVNSGIPLEAGLRGLPRPPGIATPDD